MTFATTAVVMGQAAAAQAAAAAAGTAVATAAATSGLPAAATQQMMAQNALTGAAQTAGATGTTAAGGIQGANLANIAGNTVTDAGASLMGPSGGPLALPTTPVTPEVATAGLPPPTAPVAAPMPPAGIEQIGPNMGQVNPMNTGNAVPGMPSTAPYGANYEQLSSVTNQMPEAFNTSAGSFTGVQGTPPSALERGFGKVMDWAKENPLTAAYAASTTANALMQPSDEEPEKKPSSLSKYKISPDFKGSFPTANVYKPQYQNYQTQRFAEGGIAALAQGGYPMARQNTTQFATPSQMPMSAEVVNAGYEPVEMAEGGAVPARPNRGVYSGGMQGKGGNGMQGKGGGGIFDDRGRDQLANFVRAPDVVPEPYQAEYTPETNGQVGPPSNIPMINYAAKWGGAQNLINTYAPNLTPTILSQMAPAEAAPATTQAAPMAAPAAPAASAPGYKSGGIPGPGIDTGIMSEDDPDFAFTSPYKTTAGRLDKLYKKTNVPQKAMATAPELGAIDLTPAMMKRAAQGGIMGADSSLGGYAAGGSPRLLRGPGDGMSDHIPATIADKQPARLADGEFVVPADVVSHLGNGSTEAGAKQLHGMMDRVRKARTGRKAQGKQINPKKFMPK
jgi:hypothetical protein